MKQAMGRRLRSPFGLSPAPLGSSTLQGRSFVHRSRTRQIAYPKSFDSDFVGIRKIYGAIRLTSSPCDG